MTREEMLAELRAFSNMPQFCNRPELHDKRILKHLSDDGVKQLLENVIEEFRVSLGEMPF